MLFKKGQVIVSSRKARQQGVTVILLNEDVDTSTCNNSFDYLNIWSLWFKPHRNKLYKLYKPEYDDWFGGYMTSLSDSGWHQAPKKLINLLNIPKEYLINGTGIV